MIKMGWVVFWVIVFWPAALIYVLIKIAEKDTNDKEEIENQRRQIQKLERNISRPKQRLNSGTKVIDKRHNTELKVLNIREDGRYILENDNGEIFNRDRDDLEQK